MSRAGAMAWALVMMAIPAGCGSSDAGPGSAAGADGSADASADATQAAPDATRGDDGGNWIDSSVDGEGSADGTTGGDAGPVCGHDACVACLSASGSSSCSAAFTSCTTDTACSHALQQLEACRCGDGGQCSSQCAQQCAPPFYQSGPAAQLVWKYCGSACTMCAFN